MYWWKPKFSQHPRALLTHKLGSPLSPRRHRTAPTSVFLRAPSSNAYTTSPQHLLCFLLSPLLLLSVTLRALHRALPSDAGAHRHSVINIYGLSPATQWCSKELTPLETSSLNGHLLFCPWASTCSPPFWPTLRFLTGILKLHALLTSSQDYDNLLENRDLVWLGISDPRCLQLYVAHTDSTNAYWAPCACSTGGSACDSKMAQNSWLCPLGSTPRSYGPAGHWLQRHP